MDLLDRDEECKSLYGQLNGHQIISVNKKDYYNGELFNGALQSMKNPSDLNLRFSQQNGNN
jgi:hypothetical protein